ncbi:septal ring lytic transglycosylase RlpA family protein [Imhoffiella purpurea]|uniref:Endolytic peptidoglycan transglycosylase RlpA n=1 Tax=Imhoffiella purpurea TaxID=1249627 RepID=W9VDG9_9GAMM|nr:septal ring lytic transglycosylase RlpA family protein [Imhoffiella purpurea]EXJ15031.1 Rare lipoprotein A precursor [Imhoffiella purpurea]
MMKTLAAAALLILFLPMGGDAMARTNVGQVQKGIASYYHDSLHGRRTASGQVYNKNRLSAAHKTLPLGTKVRVTDTRTGRSILVKVNDRGPFVKGRIIDLSRKAARELGIIKKGVAKVELKVVKLPGS